MPQVKSPLEDYLEQCDDELLKLSLIVYIQHRHEGKDAAEVAMIREFGRVLKGWLYEQNEH